MRTARVERKTKESHVLVELNLDGVGEISVDTGVPFFDHMLAQLGKHSGFNLTVKTTGDIDVDSHHTVEDTSLAFGQALREALGAGAVVAVADAHTRREWARVLGYPALRLDTAVYYYAYDNFQTVEQQQAWRQNRWK